jgi:hypothetical protein
MHHEDSVHVTCIVCRLYTVYAATYSKPPGGGAQTAITLSVQFVHVHGHEHKHERVLCTKLWMSCSSNKFMVLYMVPSKASSVPQHSVKTKP